MEQDPIVQEIRRHRQEYAAQFGYDLKRICADLRIRQKAGGRKVVSLPARPADQNVELDDQPAA